MVGIVAVVLALVLAAFYFGMARNHPEGVPGAVRDLLASDSAQVQDGTPQGSLLDRFRSADGSVPSVIARRRALADRESLEATGGAPTSPPTPAMPPATNDRRVSLGRVPILQFRQGEYYGPIQGELVEVSVELPEGWQPGEGQVFDERGNKVGEMGPGVFGYGDGTSCQSIPPDEMNGPPDEERPFALAGEEGIYRRTATYCGGGAGTYSGACHVHTYCVEPVPGEVGIEFTFLELSERTSAARRAVFEQVLASLWVEE